MQIASCENVGWMTYKLESRLLGEMSATSGTSLMAENEEDLKSLLMRVKKESEKIWLKTPQEKKKTKIMTSSLITS